jgi:hypothetical protein
VRRGQVIAGIRPVICRPALSNWAEPSRQAWRRSCTASAGRRKAPWHRQANRPCSPRARAAVLAGGEECPALFLAEGTFSRGSWHLSNWTNEKRIELIAERATLGLSSLHRDHLPRIVCLEQLSGFLNRRGFINCFDGADPFCWRMLP